MSKCEKFPKFSKILLMKIAFSTTKKLQRTLVFSNRLLGNSISSAICFFLFSKKKKTKKKKQKKHSLCIVFG